jgi:hypothetical protein
MVQLDQGLCMVALVGWFRCASLDGTGQPPEWSGLGPAQNLPDPNPFQLEPPRGLAC